MSASQQAIIASTGGTAPPPPQVYFDWGGTSAEGSSVTVYAQIYNWPGGTIYWEIVPGPGAPYYPIDPATDITGTYIGSVYIGPTSYVYQTLGSFSFRADHVTEGNEYWGAKIGSTPGGSDWAYNGWYNVNDTSTDPKTDFTIEWWQKMDSSQTNNYPRLFDVGSYPSESPGVSFEVSQLFIWAAGPNDYVSSSAYTDTYGIWTHWAVVRHDNTMALYKNGVNILYSNNLGGAVFNNTAQPLTIGLGSGQSWKGKVTGFHWLKGLAKYTSNFTPIRAPQSPYSTNSRLLLNVVDDAHKLADATAKHTPTASGTVAFDSDSPWTILPVTATQFGVGGFNCVFVSGAAGFTNIRPGWTISRVGGGFTSTVVAWDGAWTVTAADYWPNDGADYTFTAPTSISHYANAGNSYMIQFDQSYTDLDNVKAGWNITTTGYSAVVTQDAYSAQGAYWVGVSSPPPLANTFTLTPPQQTGSLLFTATGYVTIDASPDWGLDVGQSLGFNGSDNHYVTVSGNTSDWNLGDNWCIEWWQKIPVGASGFLSVLCQDANVPTYSGIDVFINNGNIQMFNGNRQMSEATATRGQWNHIALQKDGTTVRGFINGVERAFYGPHSGTIAPSSPLNVVIGSRTSDGGANFYGQYFNGQITNIRISDTALYSGTFTPPKYLTTNSATKFAIDGGPGSAGVLVDQMGRHTLTNTSATIDNDSPTA
jgi:hypothetical protein